MVGQNAVLISQNAFEWLSQENFSLNPFAWHVHDVRMACEWYKREKFKLSHLKGVVKTAT